MPPPTPPALRAGSLGGAGLLQVHVATAVMEMDSVFVGDGLCPANGAAGAPGKNTNVSACRPPRQRCALVRSAEPVSYRSMPLPQWWRWVRFCGSCFSRRMAPQGVHLIHVMHLLVRFSILVTSLIQGEKVGERSAAVERDAGLPCLPRGCFRLQDQCRAGAFGAS